MDLLLEIISHQRHSLPAEHTQYTFSTAGGTIGRNQNCNWCIDDPERLISGSHCSIVFENKQFYIHDTSTNGLFINDQPNPLGSGIHTVTNGDLLSLGQYQLRATLIVHQERAVYSSVSQGEQSHNPTHGIQPVPDNVSLFPETTVQELDPLASFEQSSSVPGRLNNHDILAEPDPVNGLLNSAAFNQSYVDLPNAIPEDWHSDSHTNTEHSVSTQAVPEKQPVTVQRVGNFEDFNKDYQSSIAVENQVLSPVQEQSFSGVQNKNEDADFKNTVHSQDQTADSRTPVMPVAPETHNQINNYTNTHPGIINILFDTLGIKPEDVPAEKLPQLVKNIAEISRHSMQGIMQTMNARAHLKNEFRMERTTIKTEQNNPLKFCINYEQLLHYMLTHPVPGYLNSEESVKEAFNELQEHQVAVMAGMKSALMYMLNKLSPEKIQQRSDKTISLTLSNKKTRYWEAYKELYEDIMSEDDVFNHVFGNEFCRAYEQQAELLKENRNK